ncbi:MAG: head-tail adaptor protein [Pedobacter sp.]|jgi:hypothetical protein
MTGNYDQRGTFIDFQDISDGAGGTTPERIELLRTFIAIDQIRSRSDLEQMERQLEQIYRLRIKYREAFTPTNLMYLEWNGYQYTINSVELQGTRHKREYTMLIVQDRPIETT